MCAVESAGRALQTATTNNTKLIRKHFATEPLAVAIDWRQACRHDERHQHRTTKQCLMHPIVAKQEEAIDINADT